MDKSMEQLTFDFIDEIDTDSRIVTFLLPAGLLGLNN